MTKLYPTIQTAPDNSSYQEKYHINELKKFKNQLLSLEGEINTKYNKLKKSIRNIFWVNMVSNGIGTLSAIGVVTTAVTVIGIPISLMLSGVSLTATFNSSITGVLLKKYQRKLARNRKIHEELVKTNKIFDLTFSESLNNDTLISVNEFTKLRNIYHTTMNEIGKISGKYKVVEQEEFKTNMFNEIEHLKKIIEQKK